MTALLKQSLQFVLSVELFPIITGGGAGTTMKGFRNELSDEMRWHLVSYRDNSKTSEK